MNAQSFTQSRNEETKTIYHPSSSTGPLRQGEILTEFEQPVVISLGEQPKIDIVSHPYVIVLTQDCDLAWDFKARETSSSDDTERTIPAIAFCQVTTAQALRYRDADKSTKEINKKVWELIRTNRAERYHFLEKVESQSDSLGQGLPELGADFKKCFSVETDLVYSHLDPKLQRRCYLLAPYLQHLSTRFHNYHSRVALPEPHSSEAKL